MENKQIEEMACEKCIHLEECKRIFRRAKDNGMWEHTTEEQYFSESACDCQFYADKNIYRKASEVAEEIFAEIEDFQRTLRHIFLGMCDGNDYNTLNLLQIDSAIEALFDSRIAELKKKYTEEGK